MAERARIAKVFAPLTQGEAGSFFLTDDAAVLTPPHGYSLVVTTDSVIQGIHVLPGAMPQQFAQKLMRRNLSDLAAMGATPWRYTLNLHTPAGLPESWFAAFSAALAEEQQLFNIVLIGGDSTSGVAGVPIHTTLTCFGLSESKPLRRNGAKPDDDLYVSGTIGDAAWALHLLQQNAPIDAALAARYHAPAPRLALGIALGGIASAAIDISDGLIADLSQLCHASDAGAIVQRDAIPRSSLLQPFLDRDTAVWNTILGGGDDYELLFTAPISQRDALQTLAKQLDLPLTPIGTITRDKNLTLNDANGNALPLPAKGWEHG